ncbi:hypothetical protein [Paenibacillus larvae]|nr:hypothetical protein [Paenibacillus larvae]MEC0188183.1 hypothetical protein [Paenibacillus larvae]
MEKGSTRDIEGEIASIEDIFELQDIPKMKQKELKFHKPKNATT